MVDVRHRRNFTPFGVSCQLCVELPEPGCWHTHPMPKLQCVDDRQADVTHGLYV